MLNKSLTGWSNLGCKLSLFITWNVSCHSLLAYSASVEKSAAKKPFASLNNQKENKNKLKSINNQKCQKIILHGTPTTKEFKKHSNRKTRLVGICSEAGPAERNSHEVVDHMGGAGWMGTWDSGLIVYYSSWLSLPPRQQWSTARSVIVPWWISKAPPPYKLTGARRQRNLAWMKEQRSFRKRAKWWGDSQPIWWKI